MIRILKKDMNALKKSIEAPDTDDIGVIIHPSPEVQLKYTREYLERAMTALVKAGGKYVPNQAEQRVVEILEFEWIK